MRRDSSTPRHWWAQTTLTAVVGAIGGLAGVWFYTDAPQSTFCPILDAAPRCVGQWEGYDEAEATDFFVDYLGKAGGAEPYESRNFFVSAQRLGIADEELEADWGAVQWAGMTGQATALPGFNRFEVRYQTFQGRKGTTDDEDVSEGSVTDWKLAVRLTQDEADDNEVKILKRLDWREVDIEKAHFPRVTATEPTKAYTFPTLVAKPTGAIKWNAGAGGPAFCQIEVPLRSGNYWYRTRLGWVDGSVFTIEKVRTGHPRFAEDAKLLPCPKFAAQRARELEKLERAD